MWPVPSPAESDYDSGLALMDQLYMVAVVSIPWTSLTLVGSFGQSGFSVAQICRGNPN